ncbi:MAG: hypothetical protein KVP17_004808 [Porospora cf. gigantea B]|nr:MAG: hypothetical protein KVP17_004808 [Porospora cf. gigantea B]
MRRVALFLALCRSVEVDLLPVAHVDVLTQDIPTDIVFLQDAAQNDIPSREAQALDEVLIIVKGVASLENSRILLGLFKSEPLRGESGYAYKTISHMTSDFETTAAKLRTDLKFEKSRTGPKASLDAIKTSLKSANTGAVVVVSTHNRAQIDVCFSSKKSGASCVHGGVGSNVSPLELGELLVSKRARLVVLISHFHQSVQRSWRPLLKLWSAMGIPVRLEAVEPNLKDLANVAMRAVDNVLQDSNPVGREATCGRIYEHNPLCLEQCRKLICDTRIHTCISRLAPNCSLSFV